MNQLLLTPNVGCCYILKLIFCATSLRIDNLTHRLSYQEAMQKYLKENIALKWNFSMFDFADFFPGMFSYIIYSNSK